MRRVARRTWRFFEELVGPADHWLIPDNYQEDRQDVIAHRTSPTNIGLQVLSTARRVRFRLSRATAGVLDRLEPTFDTLLRMQRYRGHFYNWYDTRTLAPLVPAYISTVDSGNLAGYLLTLRSGAGVARRNMRRSSTDACSKAWKTPSTSSKLKSMRSTAAAPRAALKRELGSLRTHLARRPATLLEWRRLLTQLEERLQAVSILFHDLEEPLLVHELDARGAARHGNSGCPQRGVRLARARRRRPLDAAARARAADGLDDAAASGRDSR